MISSGFLPVVDGVTVALYQRLRSLSQRGHEVLLLCPDYHPLASVYPHWEQYIGEILPGIRVVNLPSESFMGVEFERNLSRRANPLLQQELQAFQPDIIHVDEPDRLFLGTLNAPGVAYARQQQIPCVGFYHTNFVDYIEDFLTLPAPLISLLQWGSTQIIRRVFHAYDATFVSSPVTQQRVQRMGIKNTICDRFLGVDLSTFLHQVYDPQFFQNAYGIRGLDDTLKLTFVGRLTPDKGWRFVLRAFQDWAQHPDCQPWIQRMAILIAGDGELRDQIHDRLNALGFTVHCLGRIPPDAVPALLVNSDIHITASEKETLGLTILEAFAAGIPVLAPKAGGVTALIRDRENGLFFAPGNVDSFRRSLLLLVRDTALRDRLGNQGRQDAAAYSWEAATTNLLTVWQAIIQEKSAARIRE